MIIFAHTPQSLQEAWLIGTENAGLVCEENQCCQGQENFLLLLLLSVVLWWWPRVNIQKLLGRRPRNDVSKLGMLWTDGAIQRDLAGTWHKTAEVPVGPKNCSQEGNSGQLPGVPTGGANLSRGDDLNQECNQRFRLTPRMDTWFHTRGNGYSSVGLKIC